MIHYISTDTILPADLLAAANDAHMTVSQFEAWAVKSAVEAYKHKAAQDKAQP